MPWKSKEAKAAYDKAYCEKNKEKRKAYQQANREKVNAISSAWRKRNKAKMNSLNKRYKESKRDNNFIITELDDFVEQEMYELAQLRTETLGKDWHVDHTIPLSKGGPHAIHNLEVVPKAWNLSKSNTHSNRYREVL